MFRHFFRAVDQDFRLVRNHLSLVPEECAKEVQQDRHLN